MFLSQWLDSWLSAAPIRYARTSVAAPTATAVRPAVRPAVRSEHAPLPVKYKEHARIVLQVLLAKPSLRVVG